MAQVDGRDLFFFGGGDGRCYAFEPLSSVPTEPATLKEVWRFDGNPAGYRERGGKPIDYWVLARGAKEDFQADSNLISPSEIIGSPVFYDGHVYVTIGQDPLHGRGRGALTCIDPRGSGDITKSGVVWQYKEVGRSMSTVSIADGLLYVAETWGKVHCLDAKTGQVHWIYDTGEEIWSSTLVADGKVYVGTRKGLVVLAAGKQKRHLAEIRLGSPVWSVPAAANGVLYVASQRNLLAIEEQGEIP
jgi:outer membrane protein assembly factor BamB